MAKVSGLGQRFHIGNYTGASVFAFDLSGDVNAIDECRGGPALLEVPGINASAQERLGGVRDGGIAWSAVFNPSTGQEHDALSRLPRTDLLALWHTGVTVGDPVAGVYGVNADYAANRAANGLLLFKAMLDGDGFGLEWCQLLKPRGTDAGATNGTSIDGTGATAFGASFYVLVFSLASGTMTPEIQDSADNVSFAAITGMGCQGVTTAGANHAQRVQSATAQSIRRYVRAASTGSFTNANWTAAFIRHQTATL